MPNPLLDKNYSSKYNNNPTVDKKQNYISKNQYANNNTTIEQQNNKNPLLDYKNVYDQPNYYQHKDIETSTNNLLNNGLDVPKPDEQSTKGKKWYEQLFDPISSLQYGLARGVRNAVDDNKDTGFLQGVKEGISSGFDADGSEKQNRTSFKEVLDTMLNSNGEQRQKIGSMISNSVSDPKMILNGLKQALGFKTDTTAYEDMQNAANNVDRAKEHTQIAGLIGDMALDPANLIGGVGGAEKILSKGSSVIKMSDKLGDVKKATEILNGFGNSEDIAKEASYLVNKTAKKLGYMNDYKGVTIAGKTVITPEVIGKVADSALGKVLQPIIGAPRNIAKAVGDTKLAQDVASKLGGAYHEFYSIAKANPEKAMATMAYVDNMKKLLNEEKISKIKIIGKVVDSEPVMKAYDEEITRLQEIGDTYKTVTEITKLPNEERAALYAKEREKITNQLQTYTDKLDELKMQIDSAKDLQSKLILTDKMNKLEDIKNTQESIVKMSDAQLESTVGKAESEVIPKEVVKEPHVVKLSGSTQNGIKKERIEYSDGRVEEKTSNTLINKPKETPKSIDDEIHALDEQLGRKPTKFAEGATDEQKKITLESRKKQLNESNKTIETHRTEVKPIEEKSSEILKPEDTSNLSEFELKKKELRDLKWSINGQNRTGRAPLAEHNAIKERIKVLEEDIKKNKPVPKVEEVKKPLTQAEKDKLLPVTGETEVVKPTVDNKLNDTYKELNGKKLTDLSDEMYNRLIEAHKDANLPLDKEILDRYRSMNEYEASQKVKLLHSKVLKRNKLNEEHSVVSRIVDLNKEDVDKEALLKNSKKLEGKQYLDEYNAINSKIGTKMDKTTLSDTRDRLISLAINDTSSDTKVLVSKFLENHKSKTLEKYLENPEEFKNTLKFEREKKVVPSIDYINELSAKTHVKPRFDLNSVDFYENNAGFRNIEKARQERLLGRKSIGESGEVTDSMARQLADALTSTFKHSEWIGKAGDDITLDLKYLTKREYDTVWDTIKKSKNEPYESKMFKNYSSFNDDNKVIGKNEAVDGKNRDSWIAEDKIPKEVNPLDKWEGNDFEYVKHLMDTNSDELDNISEGMKQGIIERDLNKIEDDKDFKAMNDEFYNERAKTLPMTEKQTNYIIKQIQYVKKNRPDIYEVLRNEFKPTGKSRNTIEVASREQAGRFLNRIKELTGNSEFASKTFTKEQSAVFNEKLTKKAQALWSVGKKTDNKEMQDIANTAQKFLKNKSIKDYAQYKTLSDKLQSHFVNETVVKAIEPTNTSKIIDLATKREATKVAFETPKKELVQEAKTVEQKVVVDSFKDTVDVVGNAYKEFGGEIKNLEAKIKELNSTLGDDKLFNEYMKKKYGDMPEFIEMKKEIRTKVSGAFDSLPDEVKAIAEDFRADFKKYGIDEGVITKEEADKMYTYVAHMISPENKTKIPFEDIKLELKNPQNKHALNRKVFGNMTIDQINKFMLEKHGVEHYMETRMSYIYLKRSLEHNKFIFDKKNTDTFMKTFGNGFDLHIKPNKGDKVGWAKWFDNKANFDRMVDSGEYTIVKLDDNYKAISPTVIEGDGLEAVANHNINVSPTVEIDPRDIKSKDFFEKNKQTIFLVPKDAHKQYINVMKAQYGEQANALEKAANTFMTAWKAQALLGLGYHTNNMIGNIFNSYLSVGSKIFNPARNAEAIKVYSAHKGVELSKDSMVLGKKASEWVDILGKYGIFEGTQTKTDLSSFLTGKAESVSLKDTPLSKLMNSKAKYLNPFKTSKEVGEAIENQARLTNFFIHISEGKSVQEAVDLTNKFLFDYADTSKFENGVMKNIMPFYTWFRKNLPLQAEQLLKQPTKYGRMYRAKNDLSKPESEDQKMYRPSYLEDAIHMGNGKYVNINLPSDDLGKAIKPILNGDGKDLVSSLNPIAKLAVELYTNKNLYYGSDIEKYKGELTKSPKLMKLLAKDTPNGKMIGAKEKYAIESLLPTLKNVSNVAEGKSTAFAQGIKVYEPNIEQEKINALYNYVKKLQDAEKKYKNEGYIRK